MKARQIHFRDMVRTGASYTDRKDKLSLSDKGFGSDASGTPCGLIEVDLKQRLVRITNYRKDPATGEKVVTELPFDGMVAWYEPLSKEQEAAFYPPPSEEAAA
jgi:hypothetical protein